MEQLIHLIFMIIVFAIIGYFAFYICDKAKFPPPVLWVVGAILLIFLLYFAANQLGVSGFRLKM